MSIDLLAKLSAFATAARKLSKSCLGNCCHDSSSGAVGSTVKLASNLCLAVFQRTQFMPSRGNAILSSKEVPGVDESSGLRGSQERLDMNQNNVIAPVDGRLALPLRAAFGLGDRVRKVSVLSSHLA